MSLLSLFIACALVHHMGLHWWWYAVVVVLGLLDGIGTSADRFTDRERG